jgi:hypothetical protein
VSAESDKLREVAMQLLKTSQAAKAESERLMRKAEELEAAVEKNRKQNDKSAKR